MDMSKFNKDNRLIQHTDAIREHQISVGLMFLYLAGYHVELHYVGKPLVSAAHELLEELGDNRIPIWSCSTKNHGVWHPWQRHALKCGELDTFIGNREDVPA